MLLLLNLRFSRVDDEYFHTTAYYNLQESSGDCRVVWSWMVLENMSVELIGNYRNDNYARRGALRAFYVNPRKTFNSLRIGADIDLNKTWA